jgi:cell wall-associated NlpC family hydrolase
MRARSFPSAVFQGLAALALVLLPPTDGALAATSTTPKKKAPSSTSATTKKTPSIPSPDSEEPRPKTSSSSKSKPAPEKDPDAPKPKPKASEEKPKSTEKPKEPEDQPKPEEKPKPEAKKERAPNATLAPSDLAEFDALPPRIQRLIEAALELTKLDLTYTYGSADPARGGMDCSGTMSYLLRAQGFTDVPRDSPGQYVWARKAGGFEAVISTSADSFEFDALRPGDLLFWSGTYSVTREFPVTHVMLYLGREKKTKQRVMFGASDGRTYQGIQRWGVSVFDFKMPKKTDNSRGTTPDFLGYAPIPGVRNNPAVAAAPAPASSFPPESPPPKTAESDPPPKKSPTTSKTQKSAPTSSKSPASKKPKSR